MRKGWSLCQLYTQIRSWPPHHGTLPYSGCQRFVQLFYQLLSGSIYLKSPNFRAIQSQAGGFASGRLGHWSTWRWSCRYWWRCVQLLYQPRRQVLYQKTRHNSDSFYLDPLFYMHHTNLDRIWWLWQEASPQRLYEVDGPTSMTPPYGHLTLSYPLEMGSVGPSLPVGDIMDTRKNHSCYIYV